MRTHWCLRLLASQLARNGIHVLRFDYQGIGDSFGSPDEVVAVSLWEDNIGSALDLLARKSEAESSLLIGLRTGASLAARVATKRSDINSLLLWEPVFSGAQWLAAVRKMHAEMLDLWVCRMQTANDHVGEELLGTRYSRSLINDLEQMNIDWQALQVPRLVVDLQNCQSRYQRHQDSLQKIVLTNDDDSWNDLNQLETAWLRPETTRQIVLHTHDLFERLQKFGILDHTAEAVQ